MNEEPVQEQEYRRAPSPDIGDAVPLEPAVNLSPFGGNGTPRPDDFWLGKLANSKKKGKKTKWVDEGS
jgi:hypothetical protein